MIDMAFPSQNSGNKNGSRKSCCRFFRREQKVKQKSYPTEHPSANIKSRHLFLYSENMHKLCFLLAGKRNLGTEILKNLCPPFRNLHFTLT